MPKVHLYESDEPENFKRSLKALCGDDIKRPRLEFRLDGDLQKATDLSGIGDCKKCGAIEPTKRYVYGIRESYADSREGK